MFQGGKYLSRGQISFKGANIFQGGKYLPRGQICFKGANIFQGGKYLSREGINKKHLKCFLLPIFHSPFLWRCFGW